MWDLLLLPPPLSLLLLGVDSQSLRPERWRIAPDNERILTAGEGIMGRDSHKTWHRKGEGIDSHGLHICRICLPYGIKNLLHRIRLLLDACQV